MRLIECDRSYPGQILAIFNDAIKHSTAIWDYHPRDHHAMDQWFTAKEAGGFPVLGLVSESIAVWRG